MHEMVKMNALSQYVRMIQADYLHQIAIESPATCIKFQEKEDQSKETNQNQIKFFWYV